MSDRPACPLEAEPGAPEPDSPEPDSPEPGASRPAVPDLGGAWRAAMRAGDFAAAFRVSDAVLAGRDPAGRDDPTRPYHERFVWDGRDLRGARVLVRCYHGLGDAIQFCRYLAPLRRRAAHVTVEAPAPLLGLLATLGAADRLHPFDPAHPLPPAERDVEIMELAHALRLPPDPAPYLRVPPLAGPPGRVGLCWRAGGWAPERDMAAATLAAALGAHPRLRPVSLQRGPGAAEAAAIGAADPLGGSMDLLAMAGLIAGLDAVVSVDTMVAHLAAALGRPTVVLVPHRPDWRWSTGRRSPWYATARCYAQPAPGDWAGALAALAAEGGPLG